MHAMWWDVWKKKSVLLRQPAMNAIAPTGELPRPFEGAPALGRPTSSEERRLAASQPNELDRRRIVRALVTRKRYRYVSPSVRAVKDGYLIESPCCSRRVDPDGGVIDVARLEYVPGVLHPWSLYRKDHQRGEWELHAKYERLQELLALLNTDPQRVFWQ